MITFNPTKLTLGTSWFGRAAFALLLPLLSLAALADDYAEVDRLLNERQYAQALARSERFLATKPRDATMRFLRATALSETGRNAEAILILTQITEEIPQLAEAHNNLAVLHASQNQLDKARQSLEAAVRINPNYGTAQENLGDVYARLAAQAYNKALAAGAAASVQPKVAVIQAMLNPAQRAPAEPRAQAPAPAAPALLAVAATAQVGASTAKPAADAAAQAAVDTAVRQWAAAWAQKDIDTYFKAYAEDFIGGTSSRRAWEDLRRKRILGKNSISVELSEVSIAVAGDKANVKFRQSYKGDSTQSIDQKRLDLIRLADRWVISREN